MREREEEKKPVGRRWCCHSSKKSSALFFWGTTSSVPGPHDHTLLATHLLRNLFALCVQSQDLLPPLTPEHLLSFHARVTSSSQ